MKDMLLSAPDSQLDQAVKDIIAKWPEPYKAVNVLEALDCAVWCGGASEFCMKVFNILLETSIKAENTSYEEIVKLATWRNDKL